MPPAPPSTAGNRAAESWASPAAAPRPSYVLVSEGSLAEVPDSLDWIEAAALPEVFITAHDALFTQAGLQLGETVLIHAAASGVGTAAVQLAHAAGCLVFGTSRTPGQARARSRPRPR